MATTMTTSINTGDKDRFLATAQQIVNSLNNTPKEVRQDMLLILSSFANRLSNITSLIDGDDASESKEDRFALAEKVILRWDPSSEGSRRSLNWEVSSDEADEYLSAIDEILNLMDELPVRSDSEIMDQAYLAILWVIWVCWAVGFERERSERERERKRREKGENSGDRSEKEKER